MEHRHHVRTPIDLKTLIYRRGVPVATGRIRDASSHGLFIETECSEMHAHQRVQCELRCADTAAEAPTRVSAYVVRQSGDGAAVELDEADARVATAMIDFVKRYGVMPRRA